MNTLLEYHIGHAAIREKKIRGGLITPRLDDEDECRWFREGPVSNDKLDTIRDWPKRIAQLG